MRVLSPLPRPQKTSQMASSARIDELRKKFEENPRRYFAPLANEYRKAGEVDQAIAICRDYLPQQPGHMSGHIVYGQALYETRQFEEAKAVFETALSLDPENLIALRHLGDIALIVGDSAGARTWYGRVLEADPRNEEIQAQLKSLDLLPAPAMPTPVSAPIVEHASAAASPPEQPGASSAATVVVSAVPRPSVERTLEQPAMPRPAAASSPTTGSPVSPDGPTAEIVLDQLPAAPFAAPQHMAAPTPTVESPVPSAVANERPPGGGEFPSTGPVEMAIGFEPTSAAAQPAAPAKAAGLTPIELDSPSAATAEAPAVGAVEMEGLETTVLASAPSRATPDAAQPPDRVPEVPVEAPPPAADEPAAPSPAATRDLPLLELDTLPAAPEKVPVTVPAAVESGPFVTETMAELYLQQGHRDEARRVYRALLEQRPGDAQLLAKLANLEAPIAAPPPAASAPAVEPGAGSGRSAPSAPAGPTIKDLLRLVASRRPIASLPSMQNGALPSATVTDSPSPSSPSGAAVAAEVPPAVAQASVPAADARAPAPHAPASATDAAPVAEAVPPAKASAATSPSRVDGLAILFGAAAVSPENEAAGMALAFAFADGGASMRKGAEESVAIPGAPARRVSKDFSLDAVFGGGAPAPQPSQAASSFSFDQFFSQRATAEHPTPSGSGPTGAAGGGQPAGPESLDDVARFTQWLEGLKQR